MEGGNLQVHDLGGPVMLLVVGNCAQAKYLLNATKAQLHEPGRVTLGGRVQTTTETQYRGLNHY